MAPELTLVPLTDAEYAEFVERQVVEQARQRVNAGEWPAVDATARAREESHDLRADRLRAAGHTFLNGVDGLGARVGWLWIAPGTLPFLEGYGVTDRSRVRWLSQITVDPSLRGRGRGGALLDALHDDLASHGIAELYLRVYDWNRAAWRLYESRGYEVVARFTTDAHLRKRLPARATSSNARPKSRGEQP